MKHPNHFKIIPSIFRFADFNAAVASAFSLRAAARMDDALDAIRSCTERGGIGILIALKKSAVTRWCPDVPVK